MADGSHFTGMTRLPVNRIEALQRNASTLLQVIVLRIYNNHRPKHSLLFTESPKKISSERTLIQLLRVRGTVPGKGTASTIIGV